MPILSTNPDSAANPTRWVLETAHTGYAIGLNSRGQLVHSYWGPRLRNGWDYPAPSEYWGWVSFNGVGQLNPEEYPAYAGPNYVEPCLKVNLPDGVRDCVLIFDHADVGDGANTLVVHLKDTAYAVRLELHYRVLPAYDLIERWAVLHNETEQPITIERMFSAQWHFPVADTPYRFSHLSGKWGEEFQLRREPLTQGVKVLESRRITSSHHANPWFALDRGGADEEQGEVWFGALEWSGNWKITAERTDFYSTRVGIGLNDWDFAWRLLPGEDFTTPPALAGYSGAGFGAASRTLHRYTREQVLPHGNAPHKILYNSWEVTQFDVSEENQAAIAKTASELGVELFVMDDGWFHGREDDKAGLGDWWPDTDKFPNGLGPLIDKVNTLGMDFGLWVEPEMVNPDSDLFRTHPDWAIRFLNREARTMRNQLILNFARWDVQDYILKLLDNLLTDHNIAFIKWDMNRNVSEPGWPGYDADRDQRELWVRYVQGVYRVWGTLRERHQNVIFQSCSGGGGRADLGILRHADQIWTSDNTDAPSRLSIQEGFSQVFPAVAMEAWVTDAGHGTIPIEFRLHVSMCGALGLGGNLDEWTASERATATKWVTYYKTIRHIVQGGDLYRLHSVGTITALKPFSALQYVTTDKTQGVLFAFRLFIPQFVSDSRTVFQPIIYLRGLDPDGQYAVEGFEGTRSGAAWMYAGLSVALPNFGSTVRRITRKD